MTNEESIYGDLRRRVFDLEPSAIGLADDRLPGGVWGVVLELGLERSTVTVIALADGTTSLYTSDDFGIIGGETHPAVVVANRKLREAVAARLDAFRPDASGALPGPEDLKVRALTGTGRLVADAAQGDLLEGTHPLSDVFFAGHHVITRLREIDESTVGGQSADAPAS